MQMENQDNLPTAKSPTALTLTGPLRRPNLAVLSEDYPKVKTIDARELSGLINYILSIFNIQKPDTPEAISQMDNQMLLVGDLIRTEFGSLTVPEIKQAMKMYITQQFSELQVFRLVDCISVSSILTAFTNYRNDSLRVYLDKKRTVAEKLALPSVTESQQYDILTNGIVRVFNEYKETKVLPDLCSHIFDTLYERGKIKDAVNEKQQIYYQRKHDEAIAIVKSEMESQWETPEDLKRIRSEIKSIETGHSSAVIIKTKTLILQDYFDNIIAKGLDIKIEINNR